MSKGKALAELYRQYGPIIYSRCRRMLKDDALAEDATQDVFLRVMRSFDQAPTGTSMLPWVHRITTNYCLNAIRDRRHQPEPVGELPESAGTSPESLMHDRHLAQRLLQRAPTREREPVLLAYRDGLEHQQIAAMLGISRRTVINRLNEFMRRARTAIGTEEMHHA